MKRGCESNRIYRVRCDSGVMGWRYRLRFIYNGFPEWEHFSELYNLASRLGFKSARSAWKHNPIVEGSVEPSDYRLVKF